MAEPGLQNGPEAKMGRCCSDSTAGVERGCDGLSLAHHRFPPTGASPPAKSGEGAAEGMFNRKGRYLFRYLTEHQKLAAFERRTVIDHLKPRNSLAQARQAPERIVDQTVCGRVRDHTRC